MICFSPKFEVMVWYTLSCRFNYSLERYRLYLSTLLYIPCYIQMDTVKPVLRGHHWNKEKNGLMRQGDLLKEVQFIWNFLWQDNKKITFQYRWLLNRGDRMDWFDYIIYYESFFFFVPQSICPSYFLIHTHKKN